MRCNMINIHENNIKQDLFMRVSLDKAVKAIYSNVKLEQIINEAIANSLDAEATLIEVNIDGNQPHSGKTIKDLKITITDNGNGFTQQSLKRFTTLYDNKDSLHKGVGRLAFKRAFQKVHIFSNNAENCEVDFEFNDNLELKDIVERKSEEKTQKTVITLSDPVNDIQNIKKRNFNSSYLKNMVLKEFFVTLFSFKKKQKDINISITANITDENGIFNNGTPEVASISIKDIPDLKETSLSLNTPLVNSANKYQCFYTFANKTLEDGSSFIAISAGGRSMQLDELKNATFSGQRCIFIVFDEISETETDICRTIVTFKNPKTKSDLQTAISKKINELAIKEIIDFKKSAEESYLRLVEQKPFIADFVDKDKFGLFQVDDIEKEAYKKQMEARMRFFDMDVKSMSETEFAKRYAFAKDIFAEYVMSRFKVLEFIKSTNEKDKESVIHNLLVKQRSVIESEKENISCMNNLWLFDERFSTFDYIYSDKTISDLYQRMEKSKLINSYEKKNRPDIAIAFSDDPEKHEGSLDLVIIEIKKRNSDYSSISSLDTELSNSARAFASFFKKVNRIWYYGVADIKDEYVGQIRTAKYVPLFSKGKCFCKTTDVFDTLGKEVVTKADFYLLDYSAVLNDAEARLQSFKRVLLKAFKGKI